MSFRDMGSRVTLKQANNLLAYLIIGVTFES
jgi:hypothetical protein